MIRVFDFTCTKCGVTSEEFVEHDYRTLPCRKCGSEAVREFPAPRLDWVHMGLDEGFPSAQDKWAKAKTHHNKTDKGGSEKGQNLKMY